MEINIPRNLVGAEAQGGPGGALMQLGESISQAGGAVGGLLDNIQKNYDYNSSVKFEADLEPKLQEHFLSATQKDDGSNPKVFDEFRASQQKIVDEITSAAGKVNARVGAYVKKSAQQSAMRYGQKAQQAFFTNMLKQSVKTDEDQAYLSLSSALDQPGNPFENVKAAIEDSRTKIFSREGIYGANTQTVFDGAMSNAVLWTLDNALRDPGKAKQAAALMRDPEANTILMGYLTPEGKSKVANLLRVMQGEIAMRDGMDVGTSIFKADQTGSLETMTDNVRALKLDVDVEKNAITQIKELYNERRIDSDRRAKDARDKVNGILNDIALKRNGINRVSDLSPDQWSELIEDNPEYAKQLQDSMRREQDYEIRMRKQDALAAKQERAIAQAEAEEVIMLRDDFRTYDLKSELALKNITIGQYNRLKKVQESMDPMKHSAVKSALSKINTGSGLAASLGGLEKHEEALWKMKYSDVIKAFAEKNIDDPDFEDKLTDFMEKHIFSDMSMSWFVPDFIEIPTKRIDKFEQAKRAAGIQKDKYGFVLGETMTRNGKTYTYKGNDKWSLAPQN